KKGRFVMFRPAWLLTGLAGIMLSSCTEHADNSAPNLDQGVPRMQLNTSAFQNEGSIPRNCTGDGKDISPQLTWSGAPADVQGFALTCTDPDAPRGTFTHWVIFNIPANVHELSEGMPTEKEVLEGARQGKNDFGKIGYAGPKPPPGKPHRYFFTLYALD